MPTPATPIRLTDADKAKLDDLRAWYGLPSQAAAVRLAIEAAHRHGPPAARRPPKKSAKGA